MLNQRHHQAPSYNQPRTLREARANARRVANLYGGILERYPVDAVFNTTDVRVLVAVIFDLIEPWRGQHDD
jgi:hypothetical protein